jgi:hypothetical protein
LIITSEEPSLVNFNPRELEECFAECAGVVVDKVYIKISLEKAA